MKTLSFYDRIMLSPYLRPVTFILCIYYGLKMWELLLTLFKGA